VAGLVGRPVLGVREDHSLREAADHMVEHEVGRLVVFSRSEPERMVGIVTRGDLLAAHGRRLHQARRASRHIGSGKAREA
jgi:predicted transcriptional regulator